MNPTERKHVIKLLGGTAKTAELCQVTPGAVSQWIVGGIPDARLMFLKLARPDIFPETPPPRRRTTDHQ